MGMTLVAVLILVIPTVAALFSRGVSGALGAAILPLSFFLFSVFRLANLGAGDCGLGAGIVMACTIYFGLSSGGPLAVVLFRVLFVSLTQRRRRRGGLEFYAPEVGLTPERGSA
jgi:hypothetical protein